MRRPEATPAVVLATAAIAGGFAGGCGGSSSSSSSESAGQLSPIEATVQADCNQVPIPFNEYSTVLGGNGTNLMAPLSFTLGPDGYQFAGNSKVAGQEVAKNISRNTAALAVAWTILNQANTNLTVVDESRAVNGELTELARNPQERATICGRVVRAFLEAPAQRPFVSIPGRVTRYEPAYAGKGANQYLAGIDAVTDGNPGQMQVETIDPIAGTPNQGLQQSISRSWGITPTGQMVETEYKIGDLRISNNGSPAKVTLHGKTPVAGSKNHLQITTSGSGANKVTTVSVSGTTQNTSNGGTGTGGSSTSTGRNNGGSQKSGTGHEGTSGGHGGGSGKGSTEGSGGTSSGSGGTGTGGTGGAGGGGGTGGGAGSGEGSGSSGTGGGSGGSGGGGGETTTSTTTTETTTTPATTTTTQTTTTPGTTTTTGSKGTPNPCVPHPPYVICNN